MMLMWLVCKPPFENPEVDEVGWIGGRAGLGHGAEGETLL